MSNHVLAADTQAILLLCASFGQNRQIEPQPLTLSEYNSLAEWLRENQMRPADLLQATAKEKLQIMRNSKVHPDRLLALLERGAMLSFAVEKWTNQGLWILGRSDTHYPKRLKQILKHSAPAIIYGVGNMELLSLGGLAIIGSRNVNEEELNYTQRVARTCFQQSIQVISGGAKGVDQAAILGVLEAGGTAVGILADSLSKASVNAQYRSSIKEGKLTLISSYDPDAGFNIGNAMGRNKYVYALADYALVVNSSFGKGGTWTGAVEALSKLKDIPVFVRMDCNVSEGNQQLYNQGAKAFPSEPWNESLQKLLTKALESETKTKLDFFSKEVSFSANDIYEAVVPVILAHLQQPTNVKSLAEKLNVRQTQLQDWLNQAVTEGKVRKNKNPVTYVINRDVNQLSLF